MNAHASAGPLIDPVRMAFLRPIARLPFTNPFEPGWRGLVEAARGGGSAAGASSKVLAALTEPLAQALAVTAVQLGRGAAATDEERSIYQGAALYGMWADYGPRLQALIDRDQVAVPFYDEFVGQHRFLFDHAGLSVPEPAHLLALLYQARRAWFFAATKIRGRSASATKVRAALWRANLSDDLDAYASGLYRRMDEIPVLITGEAGTGKELAAACIGGSRYIPFDAGTRRFATTATGDYHIRNLSETPGELVDSSLFGHKRGSFTGATADMPGCLGMPKQHGSLFLDEIGELPEHVQVKLLRPLQSREYLPIGESRPQKLWGRQIFATHRDLSALCRAGKFRADLLERITCVRIRMPPLRQILAEAPEELDLYVRGFVADKLDDPGQVERWSARVQRSIAKTQRGYDWPGNLRELKNYTVNCLLSEEPSEAPPEESAPAAVEEQAGTPASAELVSSGLLGPKAKAGAVSLEELNRAYATRVHLLTGQNKAETARRLGVDWRKVGRWIDPARLMRWLGWRK